MTGNRRLLTERLRRFLLPELEKRNFRTAPLTSDEARNEIGVAFPFGRLRRAGPAGLELVEVQVDKHGRAAFRINFGIAPHDGVAHPLGHIAQDDVWVHYLPRWYALYDRALLGMRWFSVSRWRIAPATAVEYDDLVQRAVGYLPEMDEVLRGGSPGPHVRVVDVW